METYNYKGDDIPVFNDHSDIPAILEKTISGFGQPLLSQEEIPDPYELHDMDKAVKIFSEAVANNDKIKFIIDSDCDGLGTYTLWYNFFRYFPYTNIELLITDRKKGYGFIPEYVDDETRLYITSDNGITSVPATDAANLKGAKVIICDHHQPSLKLGLPRAAAIIDPYHPECTFMPKEISGTFVLWFFLKAISDKYQLNLDVYNEFLPEIAITTLSDVMPLTVPMNRFVVKDFVDKFCRGDIQHREYLNTFAREINAKPTAESFSFGLIPMINATQRMTKADHGALFLIADTPDDSLKWFEYIQELNNKRKTKQQTLLTYIEKYFKEYIDQPFIVIPGKFQKEYSGVQGIISGQLAQGNNKPCIVLNYNATKKEYSGSGRSIGELNILGVLQDNPFLSNVGGHKQALGITIPESQFDDFFIQLQSDIQQVPYEILHPKVIPFGLIPINKLNYEFFDTIHKFEPYGHKFKRPTFIMEAVIKSSRLIGKNKNHMTFAVTDKKGLIKFEGIQFFTTETVQVGETYIVHFNVDKDDYKGGDKVKLMASKFEKI